MYVVDVISQSKANLQKLSEEFNIKNLYDYIKLHDTLPNEKYSKVIALSAEKETFDKKFQKLLKDHVINSYSAQILDGKGAYIIKRLFKAYYTNPNQMQDSAVRALFSVLGEEYDRSRIMEVVPGNEVALIRVIADYISGMTDRFAYDQYDLLYGTRL